METQRAVGKLENAVSNLVAQSDKHDARLEKIGDDVLAGKGMVKAFGWVLSGLGAVGLVLLGAILNVLAKHYK